MKTKELIKLLQDQDPSGELEVTVGKTPIETVLALPAYYDGPVQSFVFDSSSEETGKIIGAEIRWSGHHLRICELSIRDALAEDPELPVVLERKDREYSKKIEAWRAEGRSRAVTRRA